MMRRAALAARVLAATSMIAGGLLSGAQSPAAAPTAGLWASSMTALAVVALATVAVLLAALPLILSRWQQQLWTAPLALVGFTGLAAVGLRLGLGAGWMLLAVVAALCAWDLEHLEERLSQPIYAGSEAARHAMQKEHARRLLAVAALGLGLGAAGLVAQARITFLLALLLSLLALLGLSWVVSFFRAWVE